MSYQLDRRVDLQLGFNFMVVFFIGGFFPNPIDTKFRKVSGLEVEIETMDMKEGGQNHFVHRLPTGIRHGNLVLERGRVVEKAEKQEKSWGIEETKTPVSGHSPPVSPLNMEFSLAMSTMTFSPSNVMVTLMDGYVPKAGWFFTKAYPVKWSVSDLDPDENAVLIDTMELAYQRVTTIRI